MTKLVPLYRKLLKTFIWIVLIFVILFFLIAGLIQIPSIQTKIVHYATSFVSSKTHTKVEIKNISISFPKSVVVEGIYLEDLTKDTLLYAGNAKLNIALFDLFSNKISISSFSLEDANLNLYSTKTDPLFNYNFLITAFSDTSSRVKADTLSPSKWTFSLDVVKLKNIRFRYNDEYIGMNVAVKLRNLDLKMDKLDLENSFYGIDVLVVEGLFTNILMKEVTTVSSQTADLPIFVAKNLVITNSEINFTDSIGKLALFSTINQVKLKDASINLQKQLLSSGTIYLSKSEITYNNFASKDSTIANPASTSENAWKVSVKKIDLEDNSIAYHSGNKPELKNSFDPDHLKYSHLTLQANELDYSPDQTKVNVKKFSAVDQNNFTIIGFETDFRMDQHSITAKKLKANTTNSSVDGDFDIQYSSLTFLIDSMQFENLNLDIQSISISNSDLNYFIPQLGKQPYFKNKKSKTSFSGQVNGSINNLSGKNVVLKAGINTILKTDFNIIGLPDYQTAIFDFPNLGINTVRKDIEMMADTLLPESIVIPENISMLIVFKGKIKSFESTANLNSSFGNANLVASVDPEENFNTTIILKSFDLGSLLNDTLMYGPVSLTAEASGKGLDMKTIEAKIKAEVSELYLNKYTYHNLSLDAAVSEEKYKGKLVLKDENAELELDALLDLIPGQEHYKFDLNLKGADLQKLNFSKTDLRIGMSATADFSGDALDHINGKAEITNIVIAQEGKRYLLNSAVLTTINEKNKSEFNVKSALVDIKYVGTVFPSSLPTGLSQFITNYFPLSDSVSTSPQLSDFNFEIQLHNHPIITAVLFPEIQEFQAGIIQGSFDSAKNNLKLNAVMNKIVYGTTEINDFSIDLKSDSKVLNYQVSCRNISNSLVSLEHFLIDGKLADNKINTSISSVDDRGNRKLQIHTQIIREKTNYKLTLDPSDFFLMDEKWNIAADNYIEFGEQGFLIHHFFINNNESQLNIASVNDQFNDDINIGIKNFMLDDISKVIEKDTAFVKGIVDGNIVLKRINNSYGLIANAKITELEVSNIPIGNLTIKADNPSIEKFNVDVNLSGTENNLTVNGFFIPNGGANSIYIKATIQSLSLKTVKVFSMGTITKASGNLSGNFLVEGNTNSPEITGQLAFDNAFITPAILNNPLELKHETFQLKKDGIYFNSFTILDANQHSAIIDGSIKMNQFSNFKFALTVNTKDFLLFNTTYEDNKEFYGRMVIDSKIDVSGPMSLPVVNAKLKLKEGSNFTFAVPEDQLITDKGEDVVEFEIGTDLNPILYQADKKVVRESGLTGFDISSVIEIDKQATLRLLMDPASTDSLVVKGEAALSFAIDRSGKMSLTGAYNLNDGSYLASLESVIKRKFDINRGSTIIWSGDPYDAEISIDAIYAVRASPIDLMAAQMSGLSETDMNSYKQRYLFQVLLKLRGQILHPVISFEIQLLPEDKGILGGAVNQKLSMLNEDESALNKQVFALLILGRFIQENPLQTEAGGSSTILRATVGKILSQQLNQWSSKVLPGVDLNFDIQSYNDYQTGQAQGRTQVDIGLKKQLFNERLSFQLGGAVDVEGEMARQNTASEITSDVTVEYKLTKDGRYRLKGFRHNQYEGVVEGQLVETGVGILYVRDFNKWKEFFRLKKEKSDTLKIKKKP